MITDDLASVRFTSFPAGPFESLYLAYTGLGITLIDTGIVSDAAFSALVVKRYGCTALRDDREQHRWLLAVEEWLAGSAEESVPLDLSRLTAFEQAVLRETKRIQRGTVRSYAWLAAAVGKPGASRAVGNVMAKNPVPLFIPCHRVVTSAGTIGQYSMGGPTMKKRLLQAEGVDLAQLSIAP